MSTTNDVMNEISKDGEAFLENVYQRLSELTNILKSGEFDFEFLRGKFVDEDEARPAKVSRTSKSKVSPGVTSRTSYSGIAIGPKVDLKLQKLEKLVQDKIRRLLDDVGAVKRYCFVKKSTRKFTNEQIITDAIQNLTLMEELLFTELERLTGFRMERIKVISKIHDPFTDQRAALLLCDFRTMTVLKCMTSKLIELYIELADLTQGVKEENEFANNFFKNLYT